MKIRDSIAASTRPFYSLEFFPPKERENWPGFFATVERLKALNPLFASVTYGAGGSTQDNTLEITSHLKNVMGLEPMAHLTCVGATRERIADYLRRLREVNVDNVLALRGDAPRGQDIDWDTAEFRYAADLVRFARNEQPDMGVGVAGYPAAHPESPSFASDLRHTADKVNAGADFIVTQLFFDVREYFDFVERLRAMGVTVPVLPGILPIQSLESVRRILSLCGANIPGKLYLELDAANEKGGADAVKEAGIAFAQQQIRSLLDGGAPGIHLYTLNRADTCLRIAEAVGMK
ncbi:methylenetetrahydrofolate reductase [NAD(P)H] [Desulfovibrio oxamicus]|uniref:Methylenetetrahydrofolate reductase n=1 Tax=Nitratidesulfovibrio oxamicus TaxID=32016 RepID=A0ABS0J319_9BACT|nr:methylenetetrahydrofolate reductase [NAD(P)H] [Nitratidesulfovibrio oxamicus]MBG3876833.1 methylenetetrahydrofolate reductase [NAD(P)H] [Nitratidesulfovibrio oxamicus]